MSELPIRLNYAVISGVALPSDTSFFRTRARKTWQRRCTVLDTGPAVRTIAYVGDQREFLQQFDSLSRSLSNRRENDSSHPELRIGNHEGTAKNKTQKVNPF